MDNQDLTFAVERLNAGDAIPEVDPALIEHFWEAASSIPPERRGHVAIGLGAFASSTPVDPPSTPEQQVAMMTRYTLLDALVQPGVLDNYMKDPSLRNRVFKAAATLPCDKNDLAEALAHKMLRESSPEAAEKLRNEIRDAGADPDHSQVYEKFLAWLRNN